MLGFLRPMGRIGGTLACSLVLASGSYASSPDEQASTNAELQKLEADRRYNKAWGVPADDASLYLRYASKMVLADRLQKARMYFLNALELDPDLVLAHRGLSDVLIQIHRPERAIAHLEAVVALSSDSNTIAMAHLDLAQIAGNAGRASEATLHYERAVAIDPSTEARLAFGKALLAEDRIERAVALFQAILESNPQHARALYHLGRARAAKDDPEAAEEFYRRALELAKAAGEEDFVERIELRLQ